MSFIVDNSDHTAVSDEEVLVTQEVLGLTFFELSKVILSQEIRAESTALNPSDIRKARVRLYRFSF